MILSTILLLYFLISFILSLRYLDDEGKKAITEKCEELNVSANFGYTIVFLAMPIVWITEKFN